MILLTGRQRQKIQSNLTTERRAAANTGFASGELACKLGALCFYSSSVLRNPPERKARNRYW